MSSSWGYSWGSAWANAWGAITTTPSTVYYWLNDAWTPITKQPKVYDGSSWVTITSNAKVYDGSTWN
jgi:hypothetical protein